MNDVIRDSSKVWIKNKVNQSTFYKTNEKVLSDESRNIGSSGSAVNAMIIHGNELKVLMPDIVGVDPRSVTANWDRVVSQYWHSISIDIYNKGKELEIGLIYDFYNNDSFFDGSSRKLQIDTLKEKGVKDHKTLMEYLKGIDANGKPNVEEHDKYRYAKPINVEEYLLWRYCQNYRDVANSIETVDSSPAIRFYVFDSNIAKVEKNKRLATDKKAMELFLKLVATPDDVDNVLFVLCGKVPTLNGINIKDLDVNDKHVHIKDVMNNTPELFIKVVTDKTLKSKAIIEKYVKADIWKRLPNTDIIVDANNAEIVIGNTVTDAIHFMNNDTNKEKMNTYTAKFKGLKL